MLNKLLAFCFVLCLCYGAKFRLDYTYSPIVNGWLKLQVVPATWNDARMRCHAKGGVLASPLTLKLQKGIMSYVAQDNPNVPTIFIGVHATFSKGDYMTVEGKPLARLPITWAPGEPNNKEDSESCLAMLTGNGTIMDVNCNDALPYVCYKAKTKKLKLTRCRTFDTEYQLEPRTGSCYKFHRWGMSWHRAFMTCAAEGSHLAIVNSEEELQILTGLYAQNTNDVITAKYRDSAFLGYHYWDVDWMTIHGQTLSEAGYENWYPGEPNNYTQPEGEFCAFMYRGGDFNDGPCSPTSPFICEKPVSSEGF